MRSETRQYLELMLHFKEAAVVGFLGYDPARYREAIQIVQGRYDGIRTIEQPDDYDTAAMSDCLDLIELLQKRLAVLVELENQAILTATAL